MVAVKCFAECDGPDCDWGWIAVILADTPPENVSCPSCFRRVRATPCGEKNPCSFCCYPCDEFGCVIPPFMWRGLN